MDHLELLGGKLGYNNNANFTDTSYHSFYYHLTAKFLTNKLLSEDYNF